MATVGTCALGPRSPAREIAVDSPTPCIHSFIHSFIHSISFHFISFHFISFHFISFHFISFHFISFHFISFHFISFHFISFHFIHMPTQGHSATGYTRAYDSVRVVSRSVRCRACVHCALSAGVCMRSVGTLFRARRIDATVGVQRSASTAPVPKGTPPRCLAHTPHTPALVPPVVDHLPCRGGVSLRSRSACAAQQGRPTPSSPEERTNCEGRKNSAVGCHFQSGPKLRVPALSAPTAVPESTRPMC